MQGNQNLQVGSGALPEAKNTYLSLGLIVMISSYSIRP